MARRAYECHTLNRKAARRLAEEYGGFSEPFDDTLEGYDDLLGVAKALLEATVKARFLHGHAAEETTGHLPSAVAT